MSTSTTLHVMTPDDTAVTRELSAWLEATHRAPVTTERLPGFPPGFYSAAGFIEDALPPTWFVVAREQPDWASVHFNSFAELSDLARQVSARLECMTVTLIAQSVAEAYFLQVFASGDHLRTLSWAGESGEWLRDPGRAAAVREVERQDRSRRGGRRARVRARRGGSLLPRPRPPRLAGRRGPPLLEPLGPAAGGAPAGAGRSGEPEEEEVVAGLAVIGWPWRLRFGYSHYARYDPTPPAPGTPGATNA